MCGICERWLNHMKETGAKVVSITRGPLPGGYSIYGYRCFSVNLSDGNGFSTSQWFHADGKKTREHLEKSFGVTATA